jgi:hypothetical protein
MSRMGWVGGAMGCGVLVALAAVSVLGAGAAIGVFLNLADSPVSAEASPESVEPEAPAVERGQRDRAEAHEPWFPEDGANGLDAEGRPLVARPEAPPPAQNPATGAAR